MCVLQNRILLRIKSLYIIVNEVIVVDVESVYILQLNLLLNTNVIDSKDNANSGNHHEEDELLLFCTGNRL